MKRLFLIALPWFVFVLTGVALAEDTEATFELPVGTMTLQAPQDTEYKATLSPVTFPHSLHFSYSCQECHHTWDGNSPIKSCGTSGCHENFWAPKPGQADVSDNNIKSMVGAFHQVCRDCHRNEADQQKAAGSKNIVTGPVACTGCHPDPHSKVVNSDESLSIPMGIITIEAPEEVEATRGPVGFPHGLHLKFACKECHHDWDGESEVEPCDACHSETEPAGTRSIKDEANQMYFLAAYHNNCLTCHRDINRKRRAAMAQEDINKADIPKATPLNCSGCHSSS
ncbi:cytochrome c3 family protein [Desulfobacter latus]|uniref:Class III cytochrome C family protein n=1 Tax=Desulfobacter latus TaxID=2292 RepID=A0A850T746_9BACT|nr:cytochrome c3 family protein [Desulfobacter latus]NWH05232.1 class III cytochrome C family protein [Desulfobacter latus]